MINNLSFLSDNSTDEWTMPLEHSEGGESLADQIAEGQLAIDVSQTPDEVIITAAMAGTQPGDMSLHLVNDVLTIRGTRRPPIDPPAEYFVQECYWGDFSRTIVLPVEVKGEMARADYKFGILTVRLPKKLTDNQIPITIVEE